MSWEANGSGSRQRYRNLPAVREKNDASISMLVPGVLNRMHPMERGGKGRGYAKEDWKCFRGNPKREGRITHQARKKPIHMDIVSSESSDFLY